MGDCAHRSRHWASLHDVWAADHYFKKEILPASQEICTSQ